ncbi:Clan CA, family C19, ubiquitin hydrolase-like cysteine peptidase [Trichomonas vaginalis G3]|uniref:Clan CA, family C19, ubiquitin hydrolase-like cysteine peptidase n=1 Tax=Trichomonas vaginalis (strain ATCC PRA-98 / G3) TaxID=412133 RepID=A2EYP5_TRIV3|nr:ubiquitinyl hydrolase protein [Trichomonas vaginalis G3]EAY02192.1 Clan CA, family C19, ubiquitin hydrolase-like cysteine peptidase [Trichomonas vaginalis G3]KAI5501075.1 ubiquitinyl hydrolase protein [Trichomonas vaginalis G3]|eukprot:XP_001314530.1 Clan CA, family C19, ubiquitin hydrolase-like cysteine peptidase [Trichomonas vaginalis G3]
MQTGNVKQSVTNTEELIQAFINNNIAQINGFLKDANLDTLKKLNKEEILHLLDYMGISNRFFKLIYDTFNTQANEVQEKKISKESLVDEPQTIGDIAPVEEGSGTQIFTNEAHAQENEHVIGDIAVEKEDNQETNEALVEKPEVPVQTHKEDHKMTTVEEDYIKKWNNLVSTNSLETLLEQSKSEVKSLFKELLDTDYPDLNKIIIQKVKSEPKVFNIQYEVFNQMSSNLSIPSSLRYSLIPILASKTTDFKAFLQNLHEQIKDTKATLSDDFVNNLISAFEICNKYDKQVTQNHEYYGYIVQDIFANLINNNKELAISDNLTSFLEHYYTFLDPKAVVLFICKKKCLQLQNIQSVKNGLQNLGGTCYLNSTIQQLFNIKEFRDLILSAQAQNDKYITALQDLFCEMQYSSIQHQISMKRFVHDFTFQGDSIDPSQQNDADEFYVDVINNVYDILKAENNLFFMRIDGDYEDKATKNVILSINDDKLSFLIKTDVNKTIAQQIDDYIAPEPIQQMSKGVMYDCLLKRKIINLPEVFVFKLERFDSSSKKNYNKSYQIQPDFVYNGVQFTLCGTVIYYGTTQHGHYYSYCKQGENWYLFNDTQVAQTSLKQVLKESNDSANMLFYRRVNNSPSSMTSLLAHDKKFMRIINKFTKSSIDTDILVCRYATHIEHSRNKEATETKAKLKKPIPFLMTDDFFKAYLLHPNPNVRNEMLKLFQENFNATKDDWYFDFISYVIVSNKCYLYERKQFWDCCFRVFKPVRTISIEAFQNLASFFVNGCFSGIISQGANVQYLIATIRKCVDKPTLKQHLDKYRSCYDLFPNY